LQELLETMGNTFVDIRDFTILLILFVFTYGLLGRELFANKVAFGEGNIPVDYETPGAVYPDSTFDTI